MSEYTASNIKILSAEEAAELFPFAKLEQLIEKYPNVAKPWIERVVKACIQTNDKPEDIIAFYCENPAQSKCVAPTDEFKEVFNELLNKKTD